MSQRTLKLHVLGSGSKGNCAVVEAPDGLVMVDAGLSCRETVRRMRAAGLDEGDVKALVVTHEHSDHVAGVPVWCKRFDGAVLASAGTLEARQKLAGIRAETFRPGDELDVCGMRVRTFATSHDVVNPVGLRFELQGDAIAIATDTGTLPEGALAALADARVLAIECNHDVGMLKRGEYPAYLKARILSDTGHLSNAQAAAAAADLVTDRTEEVLAMHLSQDNNRPSLAVRALAAALEADLLDDVGTRAARGGLRIRAAGQNRPVSAG